MAGWDAPLPAWGAMFALAHQRAQAACRILHTGCAGNMRHQLGNIAGWLALGGGLLRHQGRLGGVHPHGLADKRGIGGDLARLPLERILITTTRSLLFGWG